jgi:hypothetical protein
MSMDEYAHVRRRAARVRHALERSKATEDRISRELARTCDGGDLPPVDEARVCPWCDTVGCLSLHADDTWEDRAAAVRYTDPWEGER